MVSTMEARQPGDGELGDSEADDSSTDEYSGSEVEDDDDDDDEDEDEDEDEDDASDSDGDSDQEGHDRSSSVEEQVDDQQEFRQGEDAASSCSPSRRGSGTQKALAPAEPPSQILLAMSDMKEQDIEQRYPQVFLLLKSLVMNSRSSAPSDMLLANSLSDPEKRQLRTDSLYRELSRTPGTTWAAYSARRLLKRRSEAFLNPSERTIMGFEEADPKMWAEAVKKQKDYVDTYRRQEMERRAIKRTSEAPRKRRRRGEPRVYHCHHKYCKEVFDSRDARQAHILAVHKFTALPREIAKKSHRCPVANCSHRYLKQNGLANHIRMGHSLLYEVLDVNVLVRDVVYKFNRHLKKFRCPFNGCDKRDKPCQSAKELQDHFSEVHFEAIELMLLKKGEILKIERREAQAQKELQRLAKLKEAQKAKEFHWKKEELDSLTPNTLVWGRFRSYPFWPGLIETNTQVGDSPRILSVMFLGDNTCERISNLDKNLKEFRCKEFRENVKAGMAHKMCELFDQALKQALHLESENKKRNQGNTKSQKPQKPKGPIIDKADLRKLARRAGQEIAKHKSLWDSRKLRKLQVGNLVWYRPKSYPFWPAKIIKIDPPKHGDFPQLTVEFFGDQAIEIVYRKSDFEKNLRKFRDHRHGAYVRAGKSHPGGKDFFWNAVNAAISAERAEAGLEPEVVDSQLSSAEKDSAAISSNQPTAIMLKSDPHNVKLSREAKNLSFGAPGKKNLVSQEALQMSARERRQLARKIAMIKDDPHIVRSSTTISSSSKGARKSRSTFAWEQLHGNNGRVMVTTDVLSPPESNEQFNSATTSVQSQPNDHPQPQQQRQSRIKSKPRRRNVKQLFFVCKQLQQAFSFT